ncbi:uncharacterized protein LOC114726095 [Neltuma alba]|uniref:uncharacterized protein LOC114726095 n=1 Tax=Neltuma alba TaxID=207710 RepID=UPI0010A4A25B|nr:uncharacterized protein LOC114726095 [Prosopis alba]
MALRQTRSVSDYIERFELISATLDHCDDEVLIAAFFNGLRVEIKVDLRLLKLNSLAELMDMALRLEERNWVMTQHYQVRGLGPQRNWADERNSGGHVISSRTSTATDPVKSASYSASSSSVPKASDPSKSVTIPVTHTSKMVPKKLTDAEIERRCELGLCFKCDEKFRPGHRCKKKQLQVLILAEDPESEDAPSVSPESAIEVPETTTEEVAAPEGQLMSLSLNALAGLTGGKTIKLMGTVQGREVLILIDCGATHSFIHQDLVYSLSLPLDDRVAFTVQVGDSRNVQGRGVCRDVSIMVQGLHIIHPLYPFKLGGSDIILGADWLASLDEVLVSWKRSTLKIDMGDEWICLKGNPALQRTPMTFNSLYRSTRGDEEVFFVEFSELKMTEITGGSIDEEVQSLLREFPAVQTPLVGLPPPRAADHSIELQPGASPPNVRPYRYPYGQKTEIERLVQDMLAAGIIRPSKSPFSSPVLLVKKKDGSWHFCVDYRALNKITIQDKFPIPTIEELLDELGGARIFSKLDLKSGYHQIRMKQGEERKTAFRTHDGHYEFLVMPFGLKNAPSTFQSLMNDIFRQHLWKFILVFFDDILIYSGDRLAHLQHLKLTL